MQKAAADCPRRLFVLAVRPGASSATGGRSAMVFLVTGVVLYCILVPPPLMFYAFFFAERHALGPIASIALPFAAFFVAMLGFMGFRWLLFWLALKLKIRRADKAVAEIIGSTPTALEYAGLLALGISIAFLQKALPFIVSKL
jgi:hypothetical protein